MLGQMRRWRAAKREATTSAGLDIAGYADFTLVATGGSSIVYRAYQPAFDRQVAVKILTQPVRGARDRQRFAKELALTGRLADRHPNIVIPLDHGYTKDGRPFVTTPWYPQGSLASRLAVSALTTQEALHLGVRLAGAVATAHACGIVHRDIKPGNVLLSRHGEPVLADFGIAVSVAGTQSTAALTPAHAPPEIFENRPATSASDIWSLGSTIWTCLAGHPPFPWGGDESVALSILRVIRDPVPPLPRDVAPESLAGVLQRCMAKNPDGRPSAEAVGRQLQQVQSELNLPVSELTVLGVEGTEPDRRPELARAEPATTTRPTTDPQPSQPRPGPPGKGAGSANRHTSGAAQAGTSPSADDSTALRRPPASASTGSAPAGMPRRRRWRPALVGGLLGLAAVAGAALLLAPDAPSPAPEPTTPVSVPAMPDGLRVSQEPDGSVQLSWTDPNNGAVAYVVQVFQQSQSQRSLVARPTGLTIPDLKPGQPYCFVVTVPYALGLSPATGPFRCINGDALRLASTPATG